MCTRFIGWCRPPPIKRCTQCMLSASRFQPGAVVYDITMSSGLTAATFTFGFCACANCSVGVHSKVLIVGRRRDAIKLEPEQPSLASVQTAMWAAA